MRAGGEDGPGGVFGGVAGGVDTDAEEVGAQGVDAEGEVGVRKLEAIGGVGRGGKLGGEEGGEGGQDAEEQVAGPGSSEAMGEHSCTENRFSRIIAMQRRSKVAHF